MVDFASPLWPIGRLERLFTAIEISGWHQTRQFAYGGRPPYGLVVAYPEGMSTEPNPLSEYLRKRTFTNTPEPDVDETGARTLPPNVYCVQRHHASRLHYDLRIEVGGTLKS